MIPAVWAVVPAKCPDRGKSRLRPVLGDVERARFARSLLEHVLGVLVASEAFEGILVATDCDQVARLARARGADTRQDGAAGSLAAVVDQALADVARRGAATAIVWMADLPYLTVDDVRRLVAASRAHDVVGVPDRAGNHTNALAVTPPSAFPTCFGRPDSFHAHRAAALASGLRFARVDDEHIAFDVDWPADHARLGGGAGL